VKDVCYNLLQQSLDIIIKKYNTTLQSSNIKIVISNPVDQNLGDYSCNVSLQLAKHLKDSPLNIAHNLIDNLPSHPMIEKIEIGGIGFINFFVSHNAKTDLIESILNLKNDYGRLKIGEGQKILLEFVSANPTGPLHVGHGRGAAFGSSLASVFKFAGFAVECEYYVNDAGRQMDILSISVWLRYLDLCGEKNINFPKNAYQGDYIWDIAATLHREYNDRFSIESNKLPKFDSNSDDIESQMDELIFFCKDFLQTRNFDIVFQTALKTILNDIKKDLSLFGVEYNNWFSEKILFAGNHIDKIIKKLNINKRTYKKDGALWFSSTKMGDTKDRVLIKDNKQLTYFATDIAYHVDKYQRDYDQIINIWGADHHGYMARMRAAIASLGEDESKFKIILVQFASLYRGEIQLPMTTRGGEFVTLKELRNEIGTEAARFFYLMRKCDQHMKFDLKLAKQKTQDNPVYYIQYAHARICSILKKAKQENKIYSSNDNIQQYFHLLEQKTEKDLIASLEKFPQQINMIVNTTHLHKLCYYLQQLAKLLHIFYNSTPILSCDRNDTRYARLALISAVAIVLKNGLKLLGLKAAEKM